MKECNCHTSLNITCEQIDGKESEQMRSPGPGNLHVEITLSMLLPKGPFTCKFERMGLKISIGKGIFFSEQSFGCGEVKIQFQKYCCGLIFLNTFSHEAKHPTF